MKRQIIRIDDKLCDGCALCVDACHEGAIQIIDGKARLVSESYCDGLGACLSECPQGAILIEEREAKGFDAAAVAARAARPGPKPLTQPPPSALGHWPIQLHLVPPAAPFLRDADLVLCADCVPFAVPDFHARYLTGRAVVIACPKLDDVKPYHDKLQAMFAGARLRSVTVLRMEVPCCGGLVQLVQTARRAASADIPVEVHVIGIRGGILHVQRDA